jgi:hypothetical protein
MGACGSAFEGGLCFVVPVLIIGTFPLHVFVTCVCGMYCWLLQHFKFPADLVLPVGDVVTVWSGRDADKHEDPPRHLKWTRRNVWNDNGDVGILKDDKGEVKQRADCTPVSADEIVAAKEGNGCVVM